MVIGEKTVDGTLRAGNYLFSFLLKKMLGIFLKNFKKNKTY